MNDKSQIYLVAMAREDTKNLILKNNQWIDCFNNHEKLLFPHKYCGMGSYFMVCN